MILAGNNACPPIATARSAKIAIATVLWLNKAGIHSILINHPPVITIDRWYVYRSQMGSLWHCFNHIIDIPSSSTCPEFTNFHQFSILAHNTRQDPVVSLWNLRGRLPKTSCFIPSTDCSVVVNFSKPTCPCNSMQFAHFLGPKSGLCPQCPQCPTEKMDVSGMKWAMDGYGYTSRMATLIVNSIEQYDELWDLGQNYSVQVQTKADSLCLSPVLTVINNELII